MRVAPTTVDMGCVQYSGPMTPVNGTFRLCLLSAAAGIKSLDRSAEVRMPEYQRSQEHTALDH